MNESIVAPMRTWLARPMDQDVSAALERLRRAPDVQQIAVMPDVHLGSDVCIGVAVATAQLIYPQAVGGDIGCGMLAVALDVEAAALSSPRGAGQVLAGLGRAVPARRRNRNAVLPIPEQLASDMLSHSSLESIRRDEGALEFATLGSGNHFIEIQADEEERLWLMVHSGSRALGQAIHNHHLARAQPVDNRLRAVESTSEGGAEYLHDLSWARLYADASRRAMAEEVGLVLAQELGAHICWETVITTDHNHVELKSHGNQELWVHRKGAMSARSGELGVLPDRWAVRAFMSKDADARKLCAQALTVLVARSHGRRLAARSTSGN